MSDSDIIIRTRAIPVKPRSKNYPAGTVVAPVGGNSGGSTIISGGSGVDIIKTNDVRSLTDRNVFSSLRTLAEILSIIIPKGDTTIEISDKNVLSALRVAHELDGINKKLEEAIKSLKGLYLSKVNDDTAKGCLTLEGGAVADNIESQNFVSGALGEGFVLKRDSKTGRSYLEVDEAYIRMKAVFESLTIKELQHVGGEILLTLAGIECTKVETFTEEALCDANGNHLYDSLGRALYVPKPTGGVYRCYFKADDGSKAVQNQFVAGDMAQCKMFNIKEGVYEDVKNKYYWRLVVAVGPDYIDLGMGDCDEGSDAPQAGDKIIQLGNRTDPARQNAILMSAYGDTAPLKQMIAGINGYSLADKVILEEGFDQETHKGYTKNFGTSYVGDRDEKYYMRYTPDKGVEISGTIILKSHDNNVWLVNNKGLNIIGDESGRHIEISPSTCDLRVYNGENKVCTIVEGNDYSGIEEIYNQNTPTVTPLTPNKFQSHMCNIDSNVAPVAAIEAKQDEYFAIAEETFVTEGEVTIQYQYNYTYTLLFQGRATGSASIKIVALRQLPEDSFEQYVLLEENFTQDTTYDMHTNSIKLNLVLPVAGIYSIKVFLKSEIKILNSGTDRLVSRIRLNNLSLEIIPSGYISRIFANGLSLGNSNLNNFTVINKDYGVWGKYLHFTAENESAGIRVTNNRLLGMSKGVMSADKGMYGIIPRIIAVGIITGTSNNAYLSNVTTVDGTSLTAKWLSTGKYQIFFPEEWSSISNLDYYVMLTGMGYVKNGSTPIKGTLIERNYGSFKIELSDDETPNDGACLFEVKLF